MHFQSPVHLAVFFRNFRNLFLSLIFGNNSCLCMQFLLSIESPLMFWFSASGGFLSVVRFFIGAVRLIQAEKRFFAGGAAYERRLALYWRERACVLTCVSGPEETDAAWVCSAERGVCVRSDASFHDVFRIVMFARRPNRCSPRLRSIKEQAGASGAGHPRKGGAYDEQKK